MNYTLNKYLNKNKKQCNLIIVFILLLFNISNIYSFESIDSVFLKYEKPKINKINISNFIIKKDGKKRDFNYRYSILLLLECDKEGFVNEIKFDKILSQTSGNLKNNDQFWNYIENQILEVSKEWQLNLNNLNKYTLCEEMLKKNVINENEFVECKKNMLTRNSFEYMLIFSYNDKYNENSISILNLDYNE